LMLFELGFGSADCGFLFGGDSYRFGQFI